MLKRREWVFSEVCLADARCGNQKCCYWNRRATRQLLSLLYLSPSPKGAPETPGALGDVDPISSSVSGDDGWLLSQTTWKQTRKFCWVLHHISVPAGGQKLRTLDRFVCLSYTSTIRQKEKQRNGLINNHISYSMNLASFAIHNTK